MAATANSQSVVKVMGQELTKENALSEVRQGNTQVLKAITMGDFQDGGRLNRQQFAEFYREVFASAPALDEVRTEPLDGPEAQIDKIGLDRYLLMPVGEDEDLDNTSVNTGKVDIDVTEAGFMWELSQRVLEDTIERDNTGEVILNMHADRFGTDLEHLAFRGDETYEDTENPDYETFLSQNDGWFAKAEEEGANIESWDADVSGDLFFELEYMLEDRYLEATDPVFMCNPKHETALRHWLTDRETTLGDTALEEPYSPTPTGRPMLVSGAVPTDKVMFTDVQNLIYAPHRDMQVDVTTEGHRKIARRLDAIYGITGRFDFVVEEGEAVAILEDVNVPESVNAE